MAICPSCGKKALDPTIKSKPYLIIKEAYTQNEMEQGIPFTLSGKNKYGHQENSNSYYLMKELGMVGLNMQVMSLAAFWTHTPPKAKGAEGKEQFSKCLNWSISEVIRVSEGKRVILMMGAELVRTFTGYGVSDVSGLVCKSDLLPVINAPIIIPAPNPDNIMKVPIGELRNALKVFADQIKVFEEYAKV